MRKVLTIAAKEIRSYFVSPMGYVVLAFFLGICGLIFALTVTMTQAEASMAGIFHTMIFVSLMMVPIITMGLLSQEQATGSLELLMTNPIRETEVVLGKYLAALTLYALALLGSLEFAIIIGAFGEPDWMAILSGYIGVLLAGMAFIAIGVFSSAIVANQIAAAVLGYVMLLFFWLIGWLDTATESVIGDVAKYISILENFQDFAKGIIDSRPVIFFVSLIVFALFLSVRSLESKRTI
jgi:ABC-2 type transport system permease protein